MTREDLEDLDPGLARERTELAWTRTAISFAALGGVVLRWSPVAGAVILGMSALVYLLGRLARPAGRAGTAEHRGALLLITIAVTLVSLTALTTIFVTPGGRLPLP